MAKTVAKDSKIGKQVEKPSPAPETEKEKPKRKEKKQFPIPEEKFETWPEEFKAADHKPLKRTDFKDESVWLFHRANELEARAKSYRTQGENWKKLGSIKDQAKAKKLIKLTAEMAKLKASLEADGVNVDDLLPKAVDVPPLTPENVSV